MVTVHTQDLQTTLHALLGQAAQCDVRLSDLEARNASLESVFLAIAAGGNDLDQSAATRKGATR
jgi:ABC-2 type transport system ATP-binding protein